MTTLCEIFFLIITTFSGEHTNAVAEFDVRVALSLLYNSRRRQLARLAARPRRSEWDSITESILIGFLSLSKANFTGKEALGILSTLARVAEAEVRRRSEETF